MVGALVGLDDVWQAGGMPHSHGHLGQIMHVNELVATGDWEPLVVPHGHVRGAAAAAIVDELNRRAPQLEAANRAFPENSKQALLRKKRSRFEQPGEREGGDALRISLIERGGSEVAARFLPLPRVRS